jgi:prevent-host-death family protein
MPREVTATELKNHTGQVLEQAQHEDIIVSRQGRPYVAIIAWPDYHEFRFYGEQREVRQRRITPERWKEIQEELTAVSRQGNQNIDLAEFIARDREEH